MGASAGTVGHTGAADGGSGIGSGAPDESDVAQLVAAVEKAVAHSAAAAGKGVEAVPAVTGSAVVHASAAAAIRVLVPIERTFSTRIR